MNIRSKMTLVIVIICIFSDLTINAVFGTFFSNFIFEHEQAMSVSIRKTVNSNFEERKSKYLGTVNDWSHWDDSYNFLNNDYPNFAEKNIAETTFTSLDINFLIYTNSNDSVYYESYYDFDKNVVSESSPDSYDICEYITSYLSQQEDSTCIVWLGDAAYFIASSNVSDSTNFEQVNGKMIIGRKIDESMLLSLEEVTESKISMNMIDASAQTLKTKEPEIQSLIISDNNDFLIIRQIEANTIDPNKSVVFTMTVERTMYQTGRQDLLTLFITFTCGFILFSFIAVRVIGNIFAKPFLKIINGVKQIDITKRSAQRLDEYGKDEFSYLCKTINIMTASVNMEHEKLLASETKVRIILESIGDGVITVDIKGLIEFINQKAQKLTGWSQEEAIGKPFSQVFVIVNEDSRQVIDSPVQKVLETKETVKLANHTILISKAGIETAIEDTAAPVLNESGNLVGCVLVFKDYSEKNERRKQIEYLSYHDQLTGMYNRRFFEEELKRLDTLKNLPLHIIYADVNGLKTFNDAFGHQTGDQIIRNISDALKNVCRVDDIIARTGGDEFIILLPKTDSDSVQSIVNRIKSKVSEISIMDIKVSIALGWEAKFTKDQIIWDIIKLAEDNMYKNKILNSESKRNDVIKSILKALLIKSPREEAHSRRVGILCESIGHALHLNLEEINELRVAGELHDIGKIAVDETILNKNGVLTDSEWVQIKNHPETGFRLLGTSKEYLDVAEYVLAHHEKWNGSGYPNGSSGEQIPFKARIINLADSFDAMTSDRPYRKGMSYNEAIKEIKLCSGIQFDPALVSIFIAEQIGLF